MEPLVSIIITTRNEEKNILNCLESVNNQTYKKIEILVVDNFSIDNTKKTSLDFFKKKGIKNFKFCDFGNERSSQRNFGAQKANGKYYLYLDADMILSPNIIHECVQKFETKKNKNLTGLYIPEIIKGYSFWNRVRKFERSFYDGTAIDCVRFVPLEKFKKVQGFDETLIGPEDWDFDKKIRQLGETKITKASLYHNEIGFSLKKYLEKKKYYGLSFQKYINKWGKDDPDIKKQFSPYYRFFIVFVENGKWMKIFRHPILTLGMYFLRFLIGLQFILSSNKE